jgi:hypothetical protein
VFCNGKAILQNVDLIKEVGENRPLIRKVSGLEPNAQGKLLLEFVPLRNYATVTAIEIVRSEKGSRQSSVFSRQRWSDGRPRPSTM